MLEGQGAIHEEKGQDPVIVFQDAYFLYANNNVHSMFTKSKDEMDDEELNNLGAMNARMKLHRFGVSHKGTTEFPYPTEHIALVLDYLDKSLKEEEYKTNTPSKLKEEDLEHIKDKKLFDGS